MWTSLRGRHARCWIGVLVLLRWTRVGDTRFDANTTTGAGIKVAFVKARHRSAFATAVDVSSEPDTFWAGIASTGRGAGHRATLRRWRAAGNRLRTARHRLRTTGHRLGTTDCGLLRNDHLLRDGSGNCDGGGYHLWDRSRSRDRNRGSHHRRCSDLRSYAWRTTTEPSASTGTTDGLNRHDCQGQQNQDLPHLYLYSTAGAPRERAKWKGREEGTSLNSGSSCATCIERWGDANQARLCQPIPDLQTPGNQVSAKQLYITDGDVQTQRLIFFCNIFLAACCK